MSESSSRDHDNEGTHPAQRHCARRDFTESFCKKRLRREFLYGDSFYAGRLCNESFCKEILHAHGDCAWNFYKEIRPVQGERREIGGTQPVVEVGDLSAKESFRWDLLSESTRIS